MATNLDPALLAQILSGTGVPGYTPWTGDSGGTWQGGDAGQYVPGPQTTLIYGPQSGGSFGVQRSDVWDQAGNYLGPSSGDGNGLMALKFLAAAAAMYGGASALNGAMGGGGGVGASEVGAAEAAGGGAGGAGPGSLGSTGLDAMRAGEVAGYATNGSMPSSAAVATGGAGGGAIDWTQLAGKAAGALAGAASSRDQTQSANRDPWGPAQPLLKDLIAQAQTLSQQYQQQPFSPAQQTAYGNQAGLLNAMTSSAPGLLAGFGANASGANNYDRANPRRALTGGQSIDWQGYAPGLLQFFGGK